MYIEYRCREKIFFQIRSLKCFKSTDKISFVNNMQYFGISPAFIYLHTFAFSCYFQEAYLPKRSISACLLRDRDPKEFNGFCKLSVSRCMRMLTHPIIMRQDMILPGEKSNYCDMLLRRENIKMVTLLYIIQDFTTTRETHR